MKLYNVFEKIPEGLNTEIFEDIVSGEGVRIERIISAGQASPEGFWYDQDWNEWVILLTGSAGLLFEGQVDSIVLKRGDWVHIPSHCKHRVEWTDAHEKTVWLAVHFK